MELHGTIDVAHIRRQSERRREWEDYQQRQAEWEALKQWWSGQRRLRRARARMARMQAKLELAKTGWLYRRELARAWPKWQVARTARWAQPNRSRSGNRSGGPY